MLNQTPIVVVKDICKTFKIPKHEPVHALKHVTNHVEKREVLVVIGPSGSGKSTFLRALNGLQPIDSLTLIHISEPTRSHYTTNAVVITKINK